MKREEMTKNPIPPYSSVMKYVRDIVEFRRVEQVCKDVGSGKIHYTGEEVRRNCDSFIAYINDIRKNDYIGNINNEYKQTFLQSLENHIRHVVRSVVGSFLIDEVRRGMQPNRRQIEVQGNGIASRLIQKSVSYVEGLLLSGEHFQESATVSVDMSNKTEIHGDAIGSTFGGGTVNARDITVYNNAVDGSSRLDNDSKQHLKAARDAIEHATDLADADKADMVDELNKLTAELESPEQDAGRVQRYWTRIKEVAPPVASILSSAASLAKLLGG